LFGVLGAFDALFEGVFKTVPVGNANTGVLFAEVVIWPDDDIVVVWVPVDLIVGSAGKGVGAVCGPRLIFKDDVVLLPLREISCYAWSDFAGITVVPEVRVVGVDNNGYGGPLE
jgi:hypothetical protein